MRQRRRFRGKDRRPSPDYLRMPAAGSVCGLTSSARRSVLTARLDPLHARESARQIAAALRAVAVVFDEVRPFQDQLALARPQRDFAFAFGDDGDAGDALAAGE